MEYCEDQSLQTFCKIRQNFLQVTTRSMYKARKMSKMLKFLPCRADFIRLLCYNMSKWVLVVCHTALMKEVIPDGSKEYL